MKTNNKLRTIALIILLSFIIPHGVNASVGNPDSGDGIQDGRNVNAPNSSGAGMGNPDSGDGIPNSGNVNSPKQSDDRVMLSGNKEKVKGRVHSRHISSCESFMNAFGERYKNKTEEQVRIKYDALNKNIDSAFVRVENSDYSDDKIELYKNIFEYLRLRIQEELLDLDEDQ